METKSKLLSNSRKSSDTEKGVKVELEDSDHQDSEDEMIVLEGNEATGFLSQDIPRRNSNGSRRTSFPRKESLTLKIIPNLILADSEKSEKEMMIQKNHENEQEMENEKNYYNSNKNKGSEKGLSESQSQVGERTKNKNKNNSDNNTEESGGEKKKKAERTGWKRYLGISLAIFSSVIFSLGILIVKTFKDYHPFSIALWRFQMGVLTPSIPLILHAVFIQKKKIFKPVYPMCQPEKSKILFFLFLRAFSGCGAVVLHFYSLKYMNMSDSTVIAFSTPVFVTFLAHFFLGESCGIMNILSALVTLIGVTVICRPKFLTGEEEMDSDLLIGASLALGSMCFASCVFLSLRVLKGINYAVVTLAFGSYATIECLVLCAIVGVFQIPETSWDWFLALTLCVLTFVGQVCTTLAVKYEEAGVVALCRTFDVVFSFIWQFLFLGVIPTIFSFVGSLIVMSGVILIVFRKYLNMLPLEHPMRQRFCIILK